MPLDDSWRSQCAGPLPRRPDSRRPSPPVTPPPPANVADCCCCCFCHRALPRVASRSSRGSTAMAEVAATVAAAAASPGRAAAMRKDCGAEELPSAAAWAALILPSASRGTRAGRAGSSASAAVAATALGPSGGAAESASPSSPSPFSDCSLLSSSFGTAGRPSRNCSSSSSAGSAIRNHHRHAALPPSMQAGLQQAASQAPPHSHHATPLVGLRQCQGRRVVLMANPANCSGRVGGGRGGTATKLHGQVSLRTECTESRRSASPHTLHSPCPPT